MDDVAKLRLRHRLDRLFLLHKVFFFCAVLVGMALIVLGYGEVATLICGVLVALSGACAIASGESIVSRLTIGGVTHEVELRKQVPGWMHNLHALLTGAFMILFGAYLALWGASLVFGFALPRPWP
jgi:hypothetical protein